jgi:uncharacterized membrane protein YecN with MAPEG domain
MTSSTIAADLSRSVPERDTGSRSRPPFGFSTRVWVFMKVFLAASLACLAFYGTAKHALDWQPAAWGVADRLALVVKSAVFAVLPALIGIAVVAAQRLNPDNFRGAQVKRDSVLDINARFIQNTSEQCLLFLVGVGALAVYVKPVDATAVPVLATMFLAGRALYWWGCHHNTYVRSFGFGVTFYPTVVVFAWVAIHMATGRYIQI